MELENSGETLQERRHAGIEVRRLDVGVATWRYSARKHRRRAAVVRAWRYGGMEL